MKPFIQFTFPSGHVLEVPTLPIAEDRAKYYFERAGQTEFSTLEEALTDTTDYFDDSQEITEWLFNNMDVDQLALKHGRLVNFRPQPLDWSEVERDFHDERATVPKLEDFRANLLQVPVEMVVSSMASAGDVCGAQMLMNAADGQPHQALIFVQGGPYVVNQFMLGNKVIAESVTAKLDAALAAEQAAASDANKH